MTRDVDVDFLSPSRYGAAYENGEALSFACAKAYAGHYAHSTDA